MHGTVVAHPLRHRPGRVPRIRDHLGRRTRLGGLAAVADLHRLAERRGEPLPRCDRRRRGGRRDAAVLRLERGGELPSRGCGLPDVHRLFPDHSRRTHRLRGERQVRRTRSRPGRLARGTDRQRSVRHRVVRDHPAQPERVPRLPHDPGLEPRPAVELEPARGARDRRADPRRRDVPHPDDASGADRTTCPRRDLATPRPVARGSTRSATSTSGTATKCASARPT